MTQMNVDRLNEAFQTFATASRSLEASYGLLQERIAYLTTELEDKNRQLNDALADAEQNKDYLKAVLYNLEEAIIAVDPDGSVTMMNPAAEALLGTAAHEAAGRPFTSLPCTMTLRDRDRVLEAAGKRSTVIMSESDVVDSEGCLRGRVILIKDITRLRELELRHERNQRLIAMGEMAARLVHEIRNPLCSIELFSSMLEKELATTAHRELARGVSVGIGSLNTILTNMLFFARPNRPSLAPIRLDSVAGEAVRQLRPLLDSRNVEVLTSLVACEISGDAELLKQVFMNLLINAVQAMPGGGRIELTLGSRDGQAAVRVKDNGAGIAAEHIEKIFDPFFTTKETGTGLGLAIVNTIVQANNGYIEVASEPGQGTVFSLSFPIEENIPETRGERRGPKKAGEKRLDQGALVHHSA